MAIAKVEPLTTARALRGPFDYRLPERLGEVGVGSVLLVPFGRRRVIGVVVALAESSELPPERLAEPIEALAAGATRELVQLGLWVARQYCSTPARGLELVLPPSVGRAGRGHGTEAGDACRATEAGRAALGDGTRLGRRQRPALERLAEPAAVGVELPARQLETEDGIDRQTLGRLEARGLVSLRAEQRFRRPRVVEIGARSSRPPLSSEQSAALEAIVAAMDGDGASREHLLHGVTGSGKTEVYLAATEAALERGRGAIVLVPEIGLTPQAISRFAARFGDRVALLHSRLAAGERRDEWQRLHSGEARICVGPRSAVFAPVGDLGLVVIDEEHDSSYKQEGDPRYDAREVARHRARGGRGGAGRRQRHAPARELAGAAAARVAAPGRRPRAAAGRGRRPARTARPGRARFIRAPSRRSPRFARRAPRRSCSSTGAAGRRSSAAEPAGTPSSAPLRRLARPPQARGAPSVSSLRPRRADSRVVPRVRLGHPRPPRRRDRAPRHPARAGGGARCPCSASTPTAPPTPAPMSRSCGASSEAESGVLVGTQMVAKGHDFPDVVLSVVLDADATLRFPDFRAEERTFALVAQLAGRSGRGERGGRVLVQTLAPEAAAIRHAAAHDAEGFLAGELERRRALRYPPFSHLVRIELTSAEAGARPGGLANGLARRSRV